MNLSAKELEILNGCSSAEELVAKAAENGVELSLGQAQALMGRTEFTELDPEDLDMASGGCGTGIRELFSAGENTCYFCHEKFSGTSYSVSRRIMGTSYQPTTFRACQGCVNAHIGDENWRFE